MDVGLESPGKFRCVAVSKLMSKSKRKRQFGRYLLNAASEYAKAMKRRDGSRGAASPVRHIYNRDRDGAHE
jgi:hypothetical protein